MPLSCKDIRIGDHFTNGWRLFRCTDVGQRTIVGIAADHGTVVERRARADGGMDETRRTVDYRKEGVDWLNGPPYAVVEQVFDEYDQEGLEIVADPATWQPDDDCVQD